MANYKKCIQNMDTIEKDKGGFVFRRARYKLYLILDEMRKKKLDIALRASSRVSKNVFYSRVPKEWKVLSALKLSPWSLFKCIWDIGMKCQ